MARDEDFSNYDIQSQDRYISRATRNPPTHFDWETWRKVGQPGAYQAPPGSSAGSFRGVTSGAGAPDYRLTKESHYNEFANAGKIGEAVGEGIGSLFQGVKDLKDAKMNSNQSSSSSGGGSSSGTGTGMASGNRSQSASITGPSNSRAMRRGNNNGSMSVGGLTMVQGNDNYGTLYGNMGGANVGGGSYDNSFQSNNTGGNQTAFSGNNNSGTSYINSPGAPAPTTPTTGTPPPPPPPVTGGTTTTPPPPPPPPPGGPGTTTTTPPGGPGTTTTPPGGGGGPSRVRISNPPGGPGTPPPPPGSTPALGAGPQPIGQVGPGTPGQVPSTYGTPTTVGPQTPITGPSNPDTRSRQDKLRDMQAGASTNAESDAAGRALGQYGPWRSDVPGAGGLPRGDMPATPAPGDGGPGGGFRTPPLLSGTVPTTPIQGPRSAYDMMKDRQQKNGPKKAEPRGAAGTTGTSAPSGTQSTTKSLTKPLVGGRTPGPQTPIAGPVNPASAQSGPAERGILPNYTWTHPVTGQTMDLGHPSTQLQFTGKNDAITQRLRNI